jgi:tripartite-type tricarboxylate transporter receptor subunit TctC
VGVNHSNGIAAQKTAFLGQNTDLYFGKVGDTLGMAKDGAAKVLAVLSDKRSRFMPDIPTAREQGFDIIVGSSRGIVMQPSLDPALKAVIVSALRAAQQNPAYLKLMEEAGYEVDYKEGKEYEEYMKSQEALVVKYAEELGYNRKR